jgi:hypothetical protein
MSQNNSRLQTYLVLTTLDFVKTYLSIGEIYYTDEFYFKIKAKEEKCIVYYYSTYVAEYNNCGNEIFNDSYMQVELF